MWYLERILPKTGTMLWGWFLLRIISIIWMTRLVHYTFIYFELIANETKDLRGCF